MPDQHLDRAGDRDRAAFDTLVAPYRAELQVHCYRMLGSLQDAEDVVQETLLAAWTGLDAFENRSSVRTWLYRIATNRCLNHRRAATRRPRAAVPAGWPDPASLGELPWLQPFPDSVLDGLPDHHPGPEARYESREAITLAFVTAMQRLPPRQRATLILRDVLGYPAADTAGLLGITVTAANNALKRARASLKQYGPSGDDRTATTHTQEDEALLQRFIDAFLEFDVDAMVAFMSEDVWLRMPPEPFEFRGRESARQFFTAVRARHRPPGRFVRTRANGRPAWGMYRSDPATGLLRLASIEVAAIADGAISELTRFDAVVAPWFGLPRTLAP
ncbi:RNA polymerase subunit sigma-70 [Cryptosporangium sp. NPDC051539]|uniref:RNA polymerase subunit sigma-70 n=1 Tax=Cryptosporangium sp. NPDC051539 TaxID=3363962 RepID=UPI003799711C